MYYFAIIIFKKVVFTPDQLLVYVSLIKQLHKKEVLNIIFSFSKELLY